ncbi:MAG: AMP-dependent synthetase and ligase [Pelosinus sp.]|jgi:acyl-CoA synthetase (AMP-forming)/AMP-acid ligase II|nr:AMP-dependent synthetase and ligase [Pelosinus sp.]
MVKSAVALLYDDEKQMNNIKIILKNIPDITIVDENKSEKVIFSECGRQIRWLSNKILQDFPNEKYIGLIFKTSRELILHWFAVLDAGKEPLIIQYPTKKQSIIYWHNSISHTISSANIQGVICEAGIKALEIEKIVKTEFFDGRILEADSSCDEIINGAFIQLSSGTTGMRKGMRFTFDQLYQYIQSYNQIMEMKETDCIVSWLPLYHDMGFIACFSMPIFLGVKLVLIDPIVWVSNRSILFKTIAQYEGTLCFMPNFGFEVMAKEPLVDPLTTMRRWVSGGEPVKKETMVRFCQHINTNLQSISVVYGFAETIMAISQSNGIKTYEKEGREVTSCGKIIPGTFVKIVGNEVYAKSSYSIQAYLDHINITDSEGYIPTGDIGFIEDNELFIEGRKHDVMIQAGQKFMLNEMDIILAHAVPEWEGRGVCLAKDDARTGTQTLLVLLERENIIDIEQYKELASRLSQALPMGNFEFHFVPEEFLTKTSSGKINRKKTLEDYIKYQSWQERERKNGMIKDIRYEITQYFHGSSFDTPIARTLDSLGIIILNTIAQEQHIAISGEMSLNDIIHMSSKKNEEQNNVHSEMKEVISIVSLMDYSVIGKFTPQDMELIEREVGMPVEFEHVCMPPTPIIYHDLVFCDYFICRGFDERYSYYLNCVQKIKEANILLLDDHGEFAVGGAGAFPVMSKKFSRKAVSDYVTYRWQKYSRNHQLLPVGDVIHGHSLSPEMHLQAIKQISLYLGVPIFRAAVCENYRQLTTDWEYKDYKYSFKIIHDKMPNYSNHDKLVRSLCDFIKKHKNTLKHKKVNRVNRTLDYSDLWHFCSYCVNPIFLDQVINYFDSFIIHGFSGSLHYLQRKMEEKGKKFCFVPALNSNGGFDPTLEASHECILQTGSWGIPNTTLPVIALMAAGGPLIAHLPPDFTVEQYLLDTSFIAMPEVIKTYLNES